MTYEEAVALVSTVLTSDEFGHASEVITPETDLYVDLGMDSLDTFELGLSVTENLGPVVFSDAEAMDMKTVDDVAKLLVEKTGG